MSEPRLISPLLDGFTLGGAMSVHGGSRCYPAMHSDSDERYIVKTISIPASQVQLEALLAAGAYKTPEEARAYFRDLAKGVRREIGILADLSHRRGYRCYSAHQIVPMASGVGYEVYLISPYQLTLERQMRTESLPVSTVVRMGIDLCAALMVAREEGYLYVDMKPENVFQASAGEYLIGDLGFIRLKDLGFSSFPDRCRSSYTPPEIADAFASLNTTMDVYSLGLMLYQLCNDGRLPAYERDIPAPPCLADQALGQILCKACAGRPELRWESPADFGQALIDYLQTADLTQTAAPRVSGTTLARTTGSDALIEELSAEPQELLELLNRHNYDTQAGEDISMEELTAETQDILAQLEQFLAPVPPAPMPEPVPEPQPEPQTEPEPQPLPVDAVVEGPETAGEPDMDVDVELPEEFLEPEYQPEPFVVAPPVAQPEPEPPVIPVEPPVAAPPKPSPSPSQPTAPRKPRPQKTPAQQRSSRKFWLWVVVVALVFTCGLYYYQEVFLQTVDSFQIEGVGDMVTVHVQSQIDESLLTVVCTDTYGNPMTSTLKNGIARFSGLKPGTHYKISLTISGFHQLVGAEPATYSTQGQTQVLNLRVVTGSTDGSAVVNFVTEGVQAEQLHLTCTTEGEEPITATFSGHTTTVTGLTVGKEYTFALSADEPTILTGVTLTKHTASRVLYGKDLMVTDYRDGQLALSWNDPEDAVINRWLVRCFNDSGYDKSFEVTESNVTFTDIDPASAYTIDVTAEGMTQSARLNITAHPLQIHHLSATTAYGQINVTWNFDGDAPQEGWLVRYNIEGQTETQVVKVTEPKVVLYNLTSGSTYHIQIQSTDDRSVFGGLTHVELP